MWLKIILDPMLIQQIVFVIVLATAISLFYLKIRSITRNVKLGKSEPRNDNTGIRFKNMILVAFGQKKMFRNFIPAILHFVVYVGFILINIEVLEIFLDGLLGKHRILSQPLGSIYTLAISFFEVLGVGVIIACTIFLLRRNLFKVSRFWKKEMEGWPFLDANIILWVEIVLMAALLLMNAADLNLQKLDPDHYHKTGNFLVSGLVAPLFSGLGKAPLIGLERGMWWLHLLGILAFLNYVPFSKHLHILFAFPNTFYGDLESKGKMKNMPEIANEVKMMMDPAAAGNAEPLPEDFRFGAKDADDLTWKNLLDAYSCTECGRCTAACPANQTGKLLSPRKIMMDTRDRIEEIGKAVNKGGEKNEKSLYGHYISKEELMACTTCNACVEECPVNINPLDIILQLRRYVAMEEAGTPAEWNTMFTSMENNFAPWQFSPDDRLKWTEAE